MKALIKFVFIGLCGVASSSFASQHHEQNMKIDHFGTGNDGDNSSGLLLKQPMKLVPASKQERTKEPRIEHYGTGNDGDNTSGLLLVDHEKVYALSNTYTPQLDQRRIEHYGPGNDGDNTTGLLLQEYSLFALMDQQGITTDRAIDKKNGCINTPIFTSNHSDNSRLLRCFFSVDRSNCSINTFN